MAFPGERAIKQFPRGAADLFEGVVLYEGEIGIVLIDPDDDDADPLLDMEIRIGDGETAGGIPFITKAKTLALIAGAGLGGGGGPGEETGGLIQEGNDALALAGTNTDQRSWPATAFGQFAPKNNAVLSGTPTTTAHPAGTDSSLRLATTGFVASNFAKIGYLGSNQDEVNFPIGHRIMADVNGNSTNRNQVPPAVVRLNNDNNVEYKIGGTGAALAGTWRSRGRIEVPGGGRNFVMLERVA